MTRYRLFLPVLLLGAFCLLAPVTWADETGGQTIEPPVLKPGTGDLLPLNDFEWADFNKEHGALLWRIRALAGRAGKLGQQWSKRKNKGDEESKKLDTERRRILTQVSALRARFSAELVEDGLEPMLIAYMNNAPTGAGRVERYSHGLILLLDDLTPAQRAMFERVVTQVDGAYHLIGAQRERTMLALKQSELGKDQIGGIAGTFNRQLRVVDQRFWLLVDYVLDRDQKVKIWNRLPRRMKRKSQAVEHMYTLPGLTAAQATRIKAVLTEVEHESSPDNAAVKRVNAALKQKGLSGEDRKGLQKERGAAYQRLTELRRFSANTVKEVLTEEQYLEYVSIPPRISTNERSGNYNRVLRGFKPSAAQQAKIRQMQREQREARRAYQRRVAELRREGGDYGPDSPQMAGMQMEMAGAKAANAAANRAFIGKMFTDVLTPEQVNRWVMGHWGYKR